MLVLGGCASDVKVNPLQGIFSAVLFDALGTGADLTASKPVDPRYRYLRVEVAGRAPALMVLGYVDAHPEGEIEVWYSAGREVIKTQSGRVIATSGLELDWRTVRHLTPAPAWAKVPVTVAHYERSRDEMPGHRFGVTDRVELVAWPGVPPIALASTLPDSRARGYHWYREAAQRAGGAAHQHFLVLPPSWFALGTHQGALRVVYSEQCLSASLCLKLQRWPLEGAL